MGYGLVEQWDKWERLYLAKTWAGVKWWWRENAESFRASWAGESKNCVGFVCGG